MELEVVVILVLGLAYFQYRPFIDSLTSHKHFNAIFIFSLIVATILYFVIGHFFEKVKNKILILRQGLRHFDKKEVLAQAFTTFKLKTILPEYLRQAKYRDKTFLGLNAEGKNKEVITIDDIQRTQHMQVLGMTGTGKTESIFLPLIYQDALKGRPIIIIDAKGEMSFICKLNALLREINREKDFLLFSLAYKDISCTYNPLYVGDCDPQIIIDAFFNNFYDENSFYRNTAKTIFTNTFYILYSLGKAFTVMDVYTYLTNNQARMAINKQVSTNQGLLYLKMFNEIISAHIRKDEGWQYLLAGFYNYLLDHKDDILNDDDPDIVLSEVIRERKIVYFQLPTNAYPVQAKSIARMIQANLRYISSLIQIGKLAQDVLVSVIIDEYASFAEESFIEVLNKARSSAMMVTLAHQSLSDLTSISESFMKRVDENTLNKIYLKQTDPELCELIARSMGTYEKEEQTIRKTGGKFGNLLSMGETSNRRVKEFYFHPDRIKTLHKYGQGYFIYRGDNSRKCVNFVFFEDIKGESYKKKVKSDKKEGLRIFEEYYYYGQTENLMKEDNIGKGVNTI